MVSTTKHYGIIIGIVGIDGSTRRGIVSQFSRLRQFWVVLSPACFWVRSATRSFEPSTGR